MVGEILANPEQLLSLYSANPEKFREIIENDVSANDVIALASRREAVAKFDAMLRRPWKTQAIRGTIAL